MQRRDASAISPPRYMQSARPRLRWSVGSRRGESTGDVTMAARWHVDFDGNGWGSDTVPSSPARAPSGVLRAAATARTTVRRSIRASPISATGSTTTATRASTRTRVISRVALWATPLRAWPATASSRATRAAATAITTAPTAASLCSRRTRSIAASAASTTPHDSLASCPRSRSASAARAAPASRAPIYGAGPHRRDAGAIGDGTFDPARTPCAC